MTVPPNAGFVRRNASERLLDRPGLANDHDVVIDFE
jgi:hypothetical protein